MTAANTTRAYRADLHAWEGWCAPRHLTAYPANPGDVADFLDDTARVRSYATVRRRRSALAAYHRNHGLPSPADHEVVRAAVARAASNAQAGSGGPEPLREVAVRAALAAWADDPSPVAARDAAALALGYATAAKPGEAVAVTSSDVIAVAGGVAVGIPDRRFRAGVAWVGVGPGLAADALLRWAGTVGSGPLLRRIVRGAPAGAWPALSVHSFADIVGRAVEVAGVGEGRRAKSAPRAGFLADVADLGVPRWLVDQHARLVVGPRPDAETLVLHSPTRALGV